MKKIKILSPHEAQKVAAGEVIERPASVVKEILENALDAGATHITLYIEKAGKDLIRLVDNGCGMSAEDAKICILPHATSKITSISDLASLTSLGFRGEALASISAISHMQLKTKMADDEVGIALTVDEGKIIKEETVACSTGTDLTIADLFYNTPARKKFLKQDQTEWNQIQALITAYALSNTHIHFRLLRDSNEVLNVPPVASLKDRITQLWDHNFAQQLMPLVEQTDGALFMTGLISNHHFWRYNRSNLYFFVNNRLVKNHGLGKALLKGYKNVLPDGKFPAAFIFIGIDQSEVDVNVHPRKEEVQFAKPHTVENALGRAVTASLEQNVSKQIAPKQEVGELKAFNFDAMPFNTPQPQPASQVQSPGAPQGTMLSELLSVAVPMKAEPSKESAPVVETQKPILSDMGTIIGQFLNTYILLEQDATLILVDQHAAHERILYEKFRSKFVQPEGTRLLFPEIITLLPDELTLILQQKELFKEHGIELEAFGDGDLAIKTAPPKFQHVALKELIREVLDFISEHEKLPKETFLKQLTEHVHSQMACKGAIKAGDILSGTQINQLLIDLEQTDNRFICAHGRPTMWTLSKEEIEKKFKRIR